jgi:hypothetical protein
MAERIPLLVFLIEGAIDANAALGAIKSFQNLTLWEASTGEINRV